MIDDFVTFETAKLLKEKGFKVPTYSFFTETGAFQLNIEESFGEAEYRFDAEDFYENWNVPNMKVQFTNGKYGVATSRPTLAQVTKWLRLAYGIHIKYEPTIQGNFESFAYYNGWLFTGTNLSPEEAIEAAIVYSLNTLL